MRTERTMSVIAVAGSLLVAAAGPAGAAGPTTQRVSVSSTGAQADSSSVIRAVSADGRYVAFPSAASNLVPGDTNGRTDVFVRDRQTGTTSRVSLSGTGAQGNDYTFGGVISA